jgi:hypothetical protein
MRRQYWNGVLRAVTGRLAGEIGNGEKPLFDPALLAPDRFA